MDKFNELKELVNASAHATSAVATDVQSNGADTTVRTDANQQQVRDVLPQQYLGHPERYFPAVLCFATDVFHSFVSGTLRRCISELVRQQFCNSGNLKIVLKF